MSLTESLSRLLCDALLERALILEGRVRVPRQVARRGRPLADRRRLMGWGPVLGDHTLAFRVEDDQTRDRV